MPKSCGPVVLRLDLSEARLLLPQLLLVFSLPSLLRLVAAAAAFDVWARLSFERRGRDPIERNEERLGSRAARFFLKACKNGKTTDNYEMRKRKSCKARVLEAPQFPPGTSSRAA